MPKIEFHETLLQWDIFETPNASHGLVQTSNHPARHFVPNNAEEDD
jgi:hypothetical protein